jgi:Ni,Fe-hydrogenase III large subunit/NADH:ubiquinone oxidoreductase subunit C
MSASDWREQLALSVESAWPEPVPGLAPARLLDVNAADWGALARAAKELGCRWVAGWGEDGGKEILVNACFEKDGAYVIARARVDHAAAALPSHALSYAAADRSERHTHDLLGIHFSDHPDGRRWTRHQAWAENEYPLRKDFAAAGAPPPQTPPDDSYPFLQAQGSGVYEIPVGPVHAGIIEPGHFRFQAVGEMVLNLEEHLGYVHKGIEKIAEGRDAVALARLAGRVSGDSTVAHTWAACMAMERAVSVDVPERARYLRAIMCERERVANHLGDIGAVLNDVAFTFGFYQYARLREDWTRLSRALFDHRFMMDRVIPGGVAVDLDAAGIDGMREQMRALRPEVEQLIAIAEDNTSIEDRLETAGYLDPALAREFGTLGYVGRASSMGFDVRRDAPYAPYDRLEVAVPIYHYGDVAARVKVRGAETLVAFDLIDRLLLDLPPGPITTAWQPPASEVEGLGLVEGWRGEILSYVRFDAAGKIARFYPRDPSWLNWPALEKLMRENIVPDFPVCNKSVNGSYSGHDL